MGKLFNCVKSDAIIFASTDLIPVEEFNCTLITTNESDWLKVTESAIIILKTCEFAGCVSITELKSFWHPPKMKGISINIYLFINVNICYKMTSLKGKKNTHNLFIIYTIKGVGEKDIIKIKKLK